MPYSSSPLGTLPSRSSPTPSSAVAVPGTSLRLSTSISPALFSNELEYLHTGQGLSEAFDFLFDTLESTNKAEATELRIDKLRKDLVFMWRSRLYSDVRISLTGNFSSTDHENTTTIFSSPSHRFILPSLSYCPRRLALFHDQSHAQNPNNNPRILTLP
jgi:hypothetical protein